MVNEIMFRNAVKQLSTGSIELVIKDCENRIGSHMTHDEPDMNYVNEQKQRVEIAYKELESRMVKG